MGNRVLNIFFIVENSEISFMETIDNDVNTAKAMGYFPECDWEEARKYLIKFLNNYDSYNFLKLNKAEIILHKKNITDFEKVPFIFNSMF